VNPFSLLFSTLLVLTHASNAVAQPSFFRFDVETGARSLVEKGVAAQLGFTAQSPWRLYGEFRHTAIPQFQRDDAYRFAAEAAWEGTYFSLAAFGQGIFAAESQVTAWEFGGEVLIRFVPWVRLSSSDEILLSREDKKAEKARLARELQEKLPTAPILRLRIGLQDLQTVLSSAGGNSATHLMATFEWAPVPELRLIPTAGMFLYSTPLASDSAAPTAFSSRSLRLIRNGPLGQNSTLFGALSSHYQLYTTYQLEDRLRLALTLNAAFLATSVNMLLAYTTSLSFDYFLGDRHQWSLSPAYEWLGQGGQAYSYYSLHLIYRF
jgi:hypothetical protein